MFLMNQTWCFIWSNCYYPYYYKQPTQVVNTVNTTYDRLSNLVNL